MTKIKKNDRTNYGLNKQVGPFQPSHLSRCNAKSLSKFLILRLQGTAGQLNDENTSLRLLKQIPVSTWHVMIRKSWICSCPLQHFPFFIIKYNFLLGGRKKKSKIVKEKKCEKGIE